MTDDKLNQTERTQLAVLNEKVDKIEQTLLEIKQSLKVVEEVAILKEKVNVLQKITFGLVALLCTGVILAVLRVVLK